MSIWRAREAKKAETFGSARWANRREIARAGLLSDNGVVLGRYERHYLRHDGPEHVTEVGRRRREAEAKRSGGRIGNAEPTSEETVHTIDIRGGHRAACEGRLPKHQAEPAVMTKSSFTRSEEHTSKLQSI